MRHVRTRHTWAGLMAGIALLVSVGGAFAGSSSGTNQTVSGNIPTAGTVPAYAEATWSNCAFPILTPLAPTSCNATLGVKSNSDITLRMAATRLTDGAGHYLQSSYSIKPPTVAAFTVNPDVSLTGQVFQVGAPLNNITTYQITGTATNDNTSTLAGNYTAQLTTTIMPATTDLTAPTGLAGTAGDTQSVLTWNAAPGATSYEVAYNAGTTFTPATATVLSAGSSLTTTVTGLTNNTTYSLAVRTILGASRSGWSVPIQVTPVPLIAGLPWAIDALPAGAFSQDGGCDRIFYPATGTNGMWVASPGDTHQYLECASWGNTGFQPTTTGVDFGALESLDSLRIYGYESPMGKVVVSTFAISYSLDNITWTTLYTGTLQNITQWQTFSFTMTKARYWRVKALTGQTNVFMAWSLYRSGL